jgi:hypothetical protein
MGLLCIISHRINDNTSQMCRIISCCILAADGKALSHDGGKLWPSSECQNVWLMHGEMGKYICGTSFRCVLLFSLCFCSIFDLLMSFNFSPPALYFTSKCYYLYYYLYLSLSVCVSLSVSHYISYYSVCFSLLLSSVSLSSAVILVQYLGTGDSLRLGCETPARFADLAGRVHPIW